MCKILIIHSCVPVLLAGLYFSLVFGLEPCLAYRENPWTLMGADDTGSDLPYESNSSDQSGYVVITTSEIKANSSMLPDFAIHKESLGFDVQIITESDFGGGVGDEAAENIRAWLQRHYDSNNIEYVLLIGDPRPDSG